MSSLVPETSFAQGASGAANVYDTSPGGLGLNPSYLAPGANASATSGSSGTVSGSIPTTPSDGQGWIYIDSTNHLAWQFIYQSSDSYWYFIGGAPLLAEIASVEGSTSATYAALATAGPSVALPFSGDYIVDLGATMITASNGTDQYMSYDIGGTGAVDADSVAMRQANGVNNAEASVARTMRKTGLSVVTLTSKYKTPTTASVTFSNRFLGVTPIRVH